MCCRALQRQGGQASALLFLAGIVFSLKSDQLLISLSYLAIFATICIALITVLGRRMNSLLACSVAVHAHHRYQG